MFTGLVEEIGSVARFERHGPGGRLTIRARTVLEGTRLGDSIAVSGACLTVVAVGNDSFTVDCMPETLSHTTLGRKGTGSAVNLERSVQVGGRLGGHFVLGHVDAVAEVLGLERESAFLRLLFSLPPSIEGFVSRKGSIAIDGVSLTVIDVADGRFSVGVIPHTLTRTTLAGISPGALVNVEADVLARYIDRLLHVGREGEDTSSAAAGGLTEEYLREKGFA
jgi:riboflavin synthase